MNKKLMTGALLSMLVIASAGTVFASEPVAEQRGLCFMDQLTEEQRTELREATQQTFEEYKMKMKELKDSGATREEIGELMMQKREGLRQQKLDLLEGVGIEVDESTFGLGNYRNAGMFMGRSMKEVRIMNKVHNGFGKGFGMKLGQA